MDKKTKPKGPLVLDDINLSLDRDGIEDKAKKTSNTVKAAHENDALNSN